MNAEQVQERVQLLQTHGWDIPKSAEELGIEPRSLRRWVKENVTDPPLAYLLQTPAWQKKIQKFCIRCSMWRFLNEFPPGVASVCNHHKHGSREDQHRQFRIERARNGK